MADPKEEKAMERPTPEAPPVPEEPPTHFLSKAGIEAEVLHRSTGREVVDHDMESDFIPAQSVLVRVGDKRVPIPRSVFEALFEPVGDKRKTAEAEAKAKAEARAAEREAEARERAEEKAAADQAKHETHESKRHSRDT
jgi:hypothetical protein